MGEQNKGYEKEIEKPEIGSTLERARKERGVSLKEAEQATKISKDFLSGLERDDYSKLPEAVYVRGFVKAYANYLGLDGEALSSELKPEQAPRQGARWYDRQKR